MTIGPIPEPLERRFESRIGIRESGIETVRALARETNDAPRDNLSRSGHTRDVLFSRARARFDDPDYAGL